MKTITRILLLSLSISFFSCEERPKHDKVTASAMMEIFIDKQLKSPSTADYEFGFSKKIVKVGETGYKVRSYVDSQNGFGATIRTKFNCEVKYKAMSNSWELVTLTID